MDTITMVFQWVQDNPVLDVLILIIIPSIFEVSKININPWSALGKFIGKTINGDVMTKLDCMDKRIDGIEKRQFAQEDEQKQHDADSCRRRILTASDEMRREIRHSEEFFNQILKDISDYEHFCDKHPNYVNHRATAAIEKIHKTYQKCVDENLFL